MAKHSAPRPNNYFKVQGSPQLFNFDDGRPDSVQSALSEARALAHRLRTPRGSPAIVIWKRCAAPETSLLPVVGETP